LISLKHDDTGTPGENGRYPGGSHPVRWNSQSMGRRPDPGWIHG